MGEPSSRDLDELPDAPGEAAPVEDAQSDRIIPDDEEKAPYPDDPESASLYKEGSRKITNFTWFDLADRLKEIAPTKARSGSHMNAWVVFATSLNNYASAKNPKYQFRWHIISRAPPVMFMAQTTWSESEASRWQTLPACHRQFTCGLENSEWSAGWNDKLILRISLSATQGLIVRKKKWRPTQKDTRIHIRAAMENDSTYAVRLFRPLDPIFGTSTIPVEQRFYDAGSLFDALVNIFEEAGEDWKRKNLLKWNDVREEVVQPS